MRPAGFLLLLAVSLPAAASSWPGIPKDVWAMKDNPALVAQGAVVLETTLDFQPLYLEESLRVRILSPAGVAAAELRNLPKDLQFLDGQVVYPDGRSQPITKREDFLLHKVVSTVDGTYEEGVLIPPGVTADCVLEVRWREATARGQAKLLGRGYDLFPTLPAHYGPFHVWMLGAAYPTLSCEVRKAKQTEVDLVLLKTRGLDLRESNGAAGTSYLFKNLPAYPTVPYGSEASRGNPRVLIYEPISALRYVDTKVPPLTFWQKAVDLYLKDRILKDVFKGADFERLSREVRKDLAGTPTEKATTIAARLNKRTINVDQLLFDEKPNLLSGLQINYHDRSSLNYAAETGFVDTLGAMRLLFHVLLDEGLHPKVALVADWKQWVANPDIRTPFQFSHVLIGVEEPGKRTLWMDPEDRLEPAGEIPFGFQGIKAITMESDTWRAGFEMIPLAPPEASCRSFLYTLDVAEDQGKVEVEASFKGSPAFSARKFLGTRAPSNRETWFKERLEGRTQGLAVTRAEVKDCLDLTKPLGFAAEGTLPMEAGRLLKVEPFPGMGAALYLPPTMPQERRDLIVMPDLGVQEAHSTIHVPKGYVLKAPIAFHHDNGWGSVTLRARQDPDTGVLEVDHRTLVSGFLMAPDGYEALKDFLQWAQYAAHPDLTLEKDVAAP